MSRQLLADQVYDLLQSEVSQHTANSFRKLFAYCESNKPISKYLIEKFEILGIFNKETKTIELDEIDSYSIMLKALVFDGQLQAKCGDGRIRSLKEYKEIKILQRLLVPQTKKRTSKV